MLWINILYKGDKQMSIEQNVDKLREMREKSGKGQQKFSKLIGISEARYQNYEKGRRNLPINIAKKIALTLKVNWWELYEVKQ